MIDIEGLKIKSQELGLKILNSIEELSDFTGKSKIDFIDELGYKYSLSTQNISTIYGRKTRPNIFFNYNKYTYHNINNYFKIKNIKLELLDENPKRANEILKFKCLKHDIIFERSWNSIKNGSIYCKKCELENIREKRGNNIEYIREKAKEFDIEIISDVYINNEEKLKFICNKHKNKGIQYKSWGNILTKNNPCIYCSKENHLKKVMKSEEKFIKEVYEVHGDKYKIISNYKGSNNKVLVHCNKCGQDFEIKASHLLDGHGCGICTKSKGEEYIKLYLDNKKINNIREYKFDDCIGIKRKLPFDFYLPDYNMCIEFQGIQHYKPVEIFGGLKKFKEQQINDNIKRKYCKNNNIYLLEISYKDIESISEILDKVFYEKGLIQWEN